MTAFQPPHQERPVYQYLREHLGRRGIYLMVYGLVYLVIGLSIYLYPTTRFGIDTAPHVGVIGLLNVLDDPLWSLGWIFTGVWAVTASLFRASYQQATPRAFAALVLMPIIWSFGYIASEATWMITGGAVGNPKAWVSLIFWVALAFTAIHIAGWPDPDDPAARPRSRHDAA